MKKNYLKKLILLVIIFCSFTPIYVKAQGTIIKNFNPRTSPGIMSIRGDFALTGNSNLTVDGTLDNNSTNSNVNMRFNDVDNDTSTLNSSAAELKFRSENGSIPECTKVKFAGLYWMGRTSVDGDTLTETFNQFYNIPSGTTTGTMYHNTSNTNPTRTLTIPNDNAETVSSGFFGSTETRTIVYKVRNATYNSIEYNFVTFEINGINHYFGVSTTGNSYVILQGGNLGQSVSTRTRTLGSWGPWSTPTVTPANFSSSVVISANYTTSGTTLTATLTNPIVLDPSYNLEVLSVVRTTNSNLVSGTGLDPYRNGTGSNTRFAVNIRYSTSNNSGSYNLTKQLNKKQIRFKTPGTTNYVTLTATANNIHYPTSTNQSGIYAAYVDVTNLVNAAGEGMYWVADLAISQGNGGSAGYFGGWTLVVVYENNRMEYRDISVFDGYAYMQSNTNNSAFTYDIPISGFQARQNGPVNVKIGYIAGEGDRSISGDFMAIKRRNSTVFDSLSPYGNNTFKSNFFHSGILLDGAQRIPNYINNTGLDVAVIQLDNSQKTYIGNGDNQTTIRVGTNQDLYAIPLFVMAVDAYIPDMTPINQIKSVNGIAYNLLPNDTIKPLDTVEYQLVLQNTGSETIDSLSIQIALPLTVNYLPGSLSTIYMKPSETIGFPVAQYYDTAGVKGSIFWGLIDSFPRPANLGDTFAILTYKVVATSDCYVLLNPECKAKAAVDGFAVGVGAVSRVQIDSLPFIFGFEQTGACVGDPITTPQELVIEGTQFILDNCGQDVGWKRYSMCMLPNAQNTVPLDSLLPYFPNGSIYTNGYPTYTTVYPNGLPYPNTPNAADTYYAIPPAGSIECFFKIVVSNYQQPQYVDHDYDCASNWVQITSNIPASAAPIYTILSTYRDGAVRNPNPVSNNTGYFTGLRGSDSLVFIVENIACAMEPYGIDFPDCDGALPVEFQKFTASKIGQQVRLDWSAANEVDVKEYVIEHSVDGRLFTSIGNTVPFVSQELIKDYQLWHRKPNQGINYYRIKEIDTRDLTSYSLTKIVDFDKEFAVDIYPNPAQDLLKVRIVNSKEQNWKYFISNAAMQAISQEYSVENLVTNSEIAIPLDYLVNGLYFLNIILEDGTTINHKFVVQK